MNKEKLIEWLEYQIKINESSAEEYIQEYEGTGEEQFGKIKAFQEVIEYLNLLDEIIIPANIYGVHGTTVKPNEK
jgi:hypothetical protein